MEATVSRTAMLERISKDEGKAKLYQRLLRDYSPDDIWDTTEVQEDFTVTSFLAPYCFCTRKSDRVEGTLQFVGEPRLYFGFKPKR